jgi:PAS domain S-box-containing protein
MSLELSIFSGLYYVELPSGLIGWLWWFALFGLITYSLSKGRSFQRKNIKANRSLLIVLALMVLLTSVLFVLRLPLGGGLPPPGKPIDPVSPPLVILAALPWTMAAALFGSTSAVLLAALSGIIIAASVSNSLFTPLEYALAALVLSVFLQQRYRTLFFRAVRHPILACALVAIFYPVMFLLNTLAVSQGTIAARLDYTLTHVLASSLAFGGQLLIAGLITELILIFIPPALKSRSSFQPSPAERSLQSRFFYTMAPLAAFLLVMLIAGDWLVANSSARSMLRDRMGSTAQAASETLPFFLEGGQNLILQLSKDPRLYTESQANLNDVLAQNLYSVPFFRQLFLLDASGNSIAGYPMESYASSLPPLEEKAGVSLALNGVAIQHYTIPPAEGENAAQVSFLASVVDNDGIVRGVLIGRSDLASNPLTQPVLANIHTLVGEDGEGMLLDGSGRILYHSGGVRLMETYHTAFQEGSSFNDGTAPDGTRRLVYSQSVLGHPWSVVLSVPARRSQEMALNIAAPLLGMVFILFLAAVFVVRVGLRAVTISLHTLSVEANRIAKGQLDHALAADGEDEVGKLRSSFELMRTSLKARMDELNRLLLVSQGVASSLEIEDAVKPVLDAALAQGGSAARVALTPTAVPGMDWGPAGPTRFGAGPLSEVYSLLDDQIMGMTRQQDRVNLNNLSRVRVLNILPGNPRPEALLALALRHENHFYGVMWVGYDKPHRFTDDEIRYLATLAGQAALAAANARLFQSAEIGRQRLAAILASTPDPVLVTDHHNRLLLSNPAAWQVLGLRAEAGDGQPIQQVTTETELVKLLSATSDDRLTAEVNLPDGKVYLATASTVMAEGQRVGRVCVLRDITHLKELDALKSEFVATVSHDLRQPLSLMKGYATMLEMMGDLNEQQVGYIGKILFAVESMSRLVNNLLDLGKIEAGVDLQPELIPVREIIERVLNGVQMQAAQKKIQIEMEIPSQTIPLIEADPALLSQALQNLVENGIKYTDSGGRVKVCVHIRQNGLVFEVSDTGIGIARVDQPRLFEKFYRVSQRDASKKPGTGLGLAIVKSIAERHGGQVWVESQLGKGSTFFLLIPHRQPKRNGPGTRPNSR